MLLLKPSIVFIVVGFCSVVSLIFICSLLSGRLQNESVKSSPSKDYLSKNIIGSTSMLDPPSIISPHYNLSDNKVALIIEPRPFDHLVPLILHYAAVLAQDWNCKSAVFFLFSSLVFVLLK